MDQSNPTAIDPLPANRSTGQSRDGLPDGWPTIENLDEEKKRNPMNQRQVPSQLTSTTTTPTMDNDVEERGNTHRAHRIIDRLVHLGIMIRRDELHFHVGARRAHMGYFVGLQGREVL
jgi:hypothetical protein